MSTNARTPTPTPAPTYTAPAPLVVAAAVDEALHVARAAADRLARVMAITVAAAVRDLCAQRSPSSLVNATHAEVIETSNHTLWLTGRYWTTDGTPHRFADDLGELRTAGALFEANEWASHLDDTNWRIWLPLAEQLPDRDGHRVFRLDLRQAAALPLT